MKKSCDKKLEAQILGFLYNAFTDKYCYYIVGTWAYLNCLVMDTEIKIIIPLIITH